MNGNNKSTASRLWYCIHLADKVFFLFKTQALSNKEMITSAEANPQLLVLRMNIKRNIESYKEKLEYTKKKLYLAGY